MTVKNSSFVGALNSPKLIDLIKSKGYPPHISNMLMEYKVSIEIHSHGVKTFPYVGWKTESGSMVFRNHTPSMGKVSVGKSANIIFHGSNQKVTIFQSVWDVYAYLVLCKSRYIEVMENTTFIVMNIQTKKSIPSMNLKGYGTVVTAFHNGEIGTKLTKWFQDYNENVVDARVNYKNFKSISDKIIGKMLP